MKMCKWKCLVIAVGMSLSNFSLAEEQASSSLQDINNAINVLLGAYQGAEQVLAQQQGRAPNAIPPQDIQALREKTQDSVTALNQLQHAFRTGNAQEALNAVTTWQGKMSGHAPEQVTAEYADLMRLAQAWDNAKANFQRQHPQLTLNQLNAQEVNEFIQQLQTQLAQGSNKEQQLAVGLGAIHQIFSVAKQLLEPSDHQHEMASAALSQEVARLKSLAQQQGMTALTVPAAALVDALKARLAEHTIGQVSLAADNQTKAMLEAYLRSPSERQKISASPAYPEILSLLDHLGASYQSYFLQWQQIGNKKDNIMIDIEKSNLSPESKQQILEILKKN